MRIALAIQNYSAAQMMIIPQTQNIVHVIPIQLVVKVKTLDLTQFGVHVPVMTIAVKVMYLIPIQNVHAFLRNNAVRVIIGRQTIIVNAIHPKLAAQMILLKLILSSAHVTRIINAANSIITEPIQDFVHAHQISDVVKMIAGKTIHCVLYVIQLQNVAQAIFI